MENLDRLIHELTDYALSVALIEKEDEAYTVSRLMELFEINSIDKKRDTGATVSRFLLFVALSFADEIYYSACFDKVVVTHFDHSVRRI